MRTNETIDATLDQVAELARQLRVDSIRASTAAGSGRPTSSLSAADLMAVLLARLAVRELPGSGRPAELMDAAGIGPDAIMRAARDLLT